MPKELDVKDCFKRLRAWRAYSHDWILEAKQSYDVVDGDQWTELDRMALEEADRPVVTFNRIGAFVRGLVGLESVNRMEAAYLPMEPEDVGPIDLMNTYRRYISEKTMMQDVESQAFRDCVTCGMGWTETFITIDDNGRRQITVERRDPIMMAWDPAARQRGLLDAFWIATWVRLHRDEIKRRWPRAKDLISLPDIERAAAYEPTTHYNIEPHDATRDVWYEKDAPWSAKPKDDYLTVVQFQYKHIVPALEIEPEGADDYLPEEEPSAIQTANTSGYEYRQKFFVGNAELEDEVITEKEFTFKAMTGNLKRSSGTWYGFVRDLISPQEWSNKAYSLLIDIIASQAKGGLWSEIDAFADTRQAEQDYSNPRKIIYLRPGGLQKIQERATQGFPQGVVQVMEYANNAIQSVAGVSLEFLGLAEQPQPGVVEYQRRQSTITLLAEYFNALSLYRERHARLLAKMMMMYLNDGRMIRIAGPEGPQFIPMLLEKDFLDFDVAIDEAPHSPDVRERTWLVLKELVPFMQEAGMQPPIEILDYSPLPKSLQEKIKQSIATAEKPKSQADQIMEIEAQRAQLSAQKMQVENEIRAQEIKVKEALGQQQIQAKQLDLQRKAVEVQERLQSKEIELNKKILELQEKRDPIENNQEARIRELEIQMKVLEVMKANFELQASQQEAQASATDVSEQTQMIINNLRELQKVTAGFPRETTRKPKSKRYSLKRKGGKIVGADVEEEQENGESRRYSIDIA